MQHRKIEREREKKRECCNKIKGEKGEFCTEIRQIKNKNKITVATKKFPKLYLNAGIANGGI